MTQSIEAISKPSACVRPAGPATPAVSIRAPDQNTDWKKELAGAAISASDLLEQLNLSDHLNSIDIKPGFSLLVPASYISKMQPGDIDDPLLRQVLPLYLENDGEVQHRGLLDAVGDLDAHTAKGLLHKYHGRALIISTGACAIHCRYCFRRSYPYRDATCTSKALDETLDYLKLHPEIGEIILSGGDPLTMDDEKLASLVSKLEDIAHIHTLRIHTRLPVVLPARVNSNLVNILQSTRFQVVMVIHANHANELGIDEFEKLHSLHTSGVLLLNQSVLLKGVNDDSASLIALSKRLFECKTLPYYLHLLDPVKGAMHFDVDKNAALGLKQQVEQRLPGYLVPRLVQEIAGNKSKSAIFRI